MSKEHLTYFKVENFKRFDSLELTDIGQFNLIVGDNNVGKTSLLEALLISNNGYDSISFLRATVSWRNIAIPAIVVDVMGKIINPDFNYCELLSKNKNKPINACLITSDKKTQIKIDVKGASVDYIVDDQSKQYTIYEDNRERYAPFVPYALSFDQDLITFYSNLVNKGRSAVKDFILIIRLFIPNLEEITINKLGEQNSIFLGIEGNNDWFPLQTFGDGTKRLFRIALEISECNGKRLMIDEIDAGMHYSRMKGFLKTVFQMALKEDVQLFMTTHSQECQQAFAEVFEESDMAEHQGKVRQFTLLEKTDGSVKTVVRNFAQLEFALHTDNETRGGR